MSDKPVDARIQELETQIAELNDRLPPHSTPAAMLQELDDLEYELEKLRKQTQDQD